MLQYVTPETLTKFSTLLAGVIPDIFTVRY